MWDDLMVIPLFIYTFVPDYLSPSDHIRRDIHKMCRRIIFYLSLFSLIE